MVMTWEIGLCHGGISLKPTRVMLTGLTCLAVAAMLLRRYFHLADHAYPLLMVASAGFVSLASLAVVRRRSFLRWAVLIGLVLCWLGDFLGPRDFRAGLLAFLLAHVVFLAAFVRNGIHPRNALMVLAVLICVGITISVWLLPHVPAAERPFVVGYMLVITAMVVAAFGSSPEHSNAFIRAGAALFYVSDIFVARWKFVDPDPINAYFCYPLYYAACLLLAWGVLVHQEQRQIRRQVQ